MKTLVKVIQAVTGVTPVTTFGQPRQFGEHHRVVSALLTAPNGCPLGRAVVYQQHGLTTVRLTYRTPNGVRNYFFNLDEFPV